MDSEADLPEPLRTETENDFVIRAHYELASKIPQTDRRNEAVFAAWRRSRGRGAREDLAARKYPEPQFLRARDIPVFTEHEYVDRHGKLQRYGREELRAICDRCNLRIDDTGNFAILSEGHTPTAEQRAQGARMPPVLGYSGPFRLGQIGNVNPRWAIFADEHYSRDVADKMSRLPTRSPEVWLTEKMNDRFMDPIAALGAETPRLDMGMRFEKLGDGTEVEKYSAAAAVAPGPASVSVPELTPAANPEQSSQPGHTEDAMSLTPEDLNQIVQAIMNSDAMQWVRQKMLEEQSSMGGDDVGGEEGVPGGDSFGEGVGGPAGLPDNGGAPGGGMPPGPPPGPQSAHSPPPPPSAPNHQPPPHKKESYSMTPIGSPADYDAIRAENEDLRRRIAALEADKTKSERYSKLNGLRQYHAFDVDEEYGSTADLSDAQFVKHCDRIVAHYSRIPVNAQLYVPGDLGTRPGSVDREDYSRKVSELAQRKVMTARAAGNHGIEYEACLEEARKELGSPVTKAV